MVNFVGWNFNYVKFHSLIKFNFQNELFNR